MDHYKTGRAGIILDRLFLLAKGEKDPEVVVSIADSILKFDPLDDQAISL